MGCSKLKSIKLPNSLTKIDYDTFSGCKQLTTITIPPNVSWISSQAFRWTGLKSVISLIKTPFKPYFEAFKDIPTDVILYVPKGTKKAHEEAGWNKYFSKIIEQQMESYIK